MILEAFWLADAGLHCSVSHNTIQNLLSSCAHSPSINHWYSCIFNLNPQLNLLRPLDFAPWLNWKEKKKLDHVRNSSIWRLMATTWTGLNLDLQDSPAPRYKARWRLTRPVSSTCKFCIVNQSHGPMYFHTPFTCCLSYTFLSFIP